MCMNPVSEPADVEIQKVQAIAGNTITNEDPRFKGNRPSKNRNIKQSLRMRKPSKVVA